MIELPNKKWIRSTKQPEYAVCLDKQSNFFGWKMKENIVYESWMIAARITREELTTALKMPDFKDHLIELNDLLNA